MTHRELIAKAVSLGARVHPQGGDMIVQFPGMASKRVAVGSGANREAAGYLRSWIRRAEDHMKNSLTAGASGRTINAGGQ